MKSICILSFCLGAATLAEQAEWPRFRGPHGSGVSEQGDFPDQFGPASNVVWKTSLPSGHSSPVIWGDQIFLTGFSEGKLQTICLEKSSGKILWTKSVAPGPLERGTRTSNPAASTPVTDGQALHVYFGSFGLISFDRDGTERWRKPLPTPITQHGASTSPVAADGKLFLTCDQDVGSYLLAVDAKTGETVWRTERPDYRRGFSTPLLWPAEKPRFLITIGTLRMAAYEIDRGREQWSIAGLPNEMVSSPIEAEGLLFAAGWTHGSGVQRMPPFDPLVTQGDKDGDGRLTRAEAPAGPAQQHFFYIDADKDGAVTREEYESLAKILDQAQNALLAVRPLDNGKKAELAWKQTRGLPYVPSPLCYQGKLYLVKNGGLASCFEAQSGKVFYEQERLGVVGDFYSSPVAAGGKILVCSQPGVAVVFRSGEQLEVLARNKMEEEIMATPAVVGNRLFLRTARHLYAFGQQQE